MINWVKVILSNYYILFCSVALVVYALQITNVSMPVVVDYYLNDLLCMPIVLKSTQLIIRFLKNDNKLKLPIMLSLIITIGYSFLFEFVAPKYSLRYTADFMDVVIYLIGLVLFILLENYDLLKNRSLTR